MPVRLVTAVLTAAALGALCGCGGGGGDRTAHHTAAARPAAGSVREAPDGKFPAAEHPRQRAGHAAGAINAGPQAPLESQLSRLPQRLPGLGPLTQASVPRDARQVVVVTGDDVNSPLSGVVVYRHTDEGWRTDARWHARNARDGWTGEHYVGDLRSPIGVFALTDAGGRMPSPGTRLPYEQSEQFAIDGTGFEGESLADAFDYVIAIDYNRVSGVSPLDRERPMGDDRGGGIWFHVDHGGPTHGCVALSERHMVDLLRMLEPALHPVVVMGDGASLEK